MRLVPILAVLALVAGCATPQPGDTTTQSTTSSSATATAGATLGTLWLHADGQRTWMDQQAGGGVDSPMASVATRPATLLFPLTPPPAQPVATSGLAFAHITSPSPGSVGSITIKVTLLVGGQPFSTSTQQGQDTQHTMAAPPLIAAGETLAIEVCLCDATAQTYLLDTTGRSTATIPGPLPPATPTPEGALPAGPATTRADGDAWIAERTDAASVEVPAGDGKVRLASVNGNVAQVTGTPGFEAHLWARGATEQQARDRLATLYVSFTLGTEGGLDLDAEVMTTDTSPEAWSDKGGDLDLTLPEALVLSRASLGTTNGDVASQGFTVGDLSMATTNGDLDASGSFSSWSGSTTNGVITGESDAPAESGAISLAATNGDVDLVLAQDSNHGIDASAATTNGIATLDFAEAEPVGSQSENEAHVRTVGYDDKEIKTSVSMAVTNGDISAADS